MDKSTLHMIQEVLSFPMEEHFRIVQDIDNGVIKINNSRKIKQLKTLSQDHDREIARFRTFFLESIFIDNRSFEEAVVNFFLAITKVKEKYSKSLKSLKADINQAESGRMPVAFRALHYCCGDPAPAAFALNNQGATVAMSTEQAAIVPFVLVKAIDSDFTLYSSV